MQLTGFHPHGAKAVTLVELIMVVTLVGIMAAFVIPNYSKAVAKSYEKAGYNNLLTIFSAQKISYNNGNGYKACADTAAVNNNLSLGIIDTNINYRCVVPSVNRPAPSFDCFAARTDTSFTLKVIEDANAGVCCCSGTCYTVPVCAIAC